MFWIPICAIIGIFYYIHACADAAKTGRYNAEVNRQNEIASSFRQRVQDDGFEARMREKYDGKYSACYETICDFVGCKPDTPEVYPLINHWDIMARAAVMSKSGRLPFMMLYGELNNMIYKDNGIRAWHEKYLLRLESELRRSGVNTFVVCECKTTDAKGNPAYAPVKLKDYVERYGYGKTTNSVPLKFVQLSNCSLMFPEIS